ncbi:hypothetical protein ACFSCX_04610 [Bacillus salitolerans]|uniref:Swarming motility protein SwrB n=1 Tax=Bacillus salitolerans TaxID=1437434 RepID=A0ABW4LLA4_9BACI
MNTFLLVISFILHAISFLIIVLLFYKLEQTKSIERKQEAMMKDMENLLSSYVMEMKEENETFLRMVSQENHQNANNYLQSAKPPIVQEQETVLSKIDQTEQQLSNEVLQDLLPKYEQEANTLLQAVQESKEIDRINKLPIQEQAKILHNQGLSIEEIAKKLSKGKTEIELYLKFYS